MKPGDGVTDDQVMELAQLFFAIKDKWPTVQSVLNDEAISAMRAGLFDAERPREYYAGYVVALEFLSSLPRRVEERAEAIRLEREAESEANAPRVVESLRRQIENLPGPKRRTPTGGPTGV